MRDIRKKGWFWIENSLIDRDDLNPYEKLLYMTLARYCDSDGKCFPAIETLMKATGINGKATVVKYLKNLEKKELIFVVRNSGKSNIYYLKNSDKKEAEQFNSDTGSINEPVHEMNYTSSGVEPLPVHEMNPKETKLTKHIEQDKKEKINKKEKSQTEVLTDYVDGLDLDTEKKEIFKKWIIYKKDNKQYKNTISIDSLIKKWGCYSSVELEEIVENSISNGYQGLFELKKGLTKSEEKRIISQNTGKVKTKPDAWYNELKESDGDVYPWDN